MTLGPADLAIAGGATLVAGAVNAIAGGGTLVSFPTLVALGVPSLPANVTNTVALCPGYLSGAAAQRSELRERRTVLRYVVGPAAVGGLAGAVLLQVTPESSFRDAVPWLVLLSCALLLAQDRLRSLLQRRTTAPVGSPGGASTGAATSGADGRPGAPAMVAVAAAALYGGFFGAGLGIMLLAILGLLRADDLVHTNGIKQVLSLVINVGAAALFAATGHVRWELVPVMAVAALIGGSIGGRLARVVNPVWLRRVVVLFGIGVAIQFWVS